MLWMLSTAAFKPGARKAELVAEMEARKAELVAELGGRAAVGDRAAVASLQV